MDNENWYMNEAGVSIQVGQTVSYEDMANPHDEGVVVKIIRHEGETHFLLFGGSTPMEPIRAEAVVIFPGSWHKSNVLMNSLNAHQYAGWQIVDKPVLSQDEVNRIVAEYERMQPILRAQREQSEQMKHEADEREKARLKSIHPELISTGFCNLSQYALGAKNLRTELRSAFPRAKFSVTSESYSMGCSINVHWTNGPGYDVVDKIARKYQYGHFDGSEDLYHYHDEVWTDVFGGAKYVSCSREITEDIQEAVGRAMAEHEQISFISLDFNDPVLHERLSFWSWRDAVYRFLHNANLTFFNGIETVECSAGTYPNDFYKLKEAA